MDSQENVKRRIAADGFLKQVSIEIYPEGASDEERKATVKIWCADARPAGCDSQTETGKRIFPTKKRVGKECFEEKSVRDSMMSGYESGQGKLWIVDNGIRAQELLEQGCPVLVWLHEDNRDQDFSGVRYACENISELDLIIWRRSIADTWAFPGRF